MGVKPGEEVVGAKGGGGGTEAKAGNATAGVARTKPAFVSLVPPKRKLVKKMINQIKKEMEAKQGKKVIGAKGGGATEAVVVNPIAGAARTKPTSESLVPPKRKSVKKMMGDATIKAIASCVCSTNQQKDKTHSV
ncbi:hypothetical protein RHSIM_Rhsim11G0073400 [Rhododendron simsii]|uniref:Uncharacterized protein n=1 Tax=Rhododendron simsii TaxID=118357 RepID=A0A834LBU1_RHOSS|nr:hypothetical protein RHSIM_Rhsim11G0073400 [Rhododendron simsii]